MQPGELGGGPGVRLRRATGQQIGGERCRANGSGRRGTGCVREARSPGTGLAGTGSLVHREERRAGLAIEHEDEALLGRLRHRVDRAAVARTVTSVGGGGKSRSQMSWCTAWKCQTPLAGGGVERQQAVGEQVVAGAVGAVEVGRRRSGRHEDDARAPRRAPCRPSCWRRR